jgi:hypothetical protein
MKLPNAEKAIVAEAKLIQYLLNETHPTGKDKAAFFVRFGFSAAKWEILKQALLSHAAANEVTSSLTTPEGIHYAVDGPLLSPDGRNPLLKSVWTIDTDSDIPRFVTAYPLKKRKDDES